MISAARNLFQSLLKPHIKKVFFPSLEFNRKLLLWYADKVVLENSIVEPKETLKQVDELRKKGTPLTFICNHLTYADSHVIEALLIRKGFRDLADHMVHIAGQKTFEFSRRVLTRSLNTIRVYQPKANIDSILKKKMNARALKWAAHLKRRGYSLLVFPEGTRTRLEKRFNLKSANPKTTIYFRNSKVIPLALMGSEKVMPVGSILQHRAAVELRVGNPIDHAELEKQFRANHPDQTERELRQNLMLHYMNQIDGLLDPNYKSVE